MWSDWNILDILYKIYWNINAFDIPSFQKDEIFIFFKVAMTLNWKHMILYYSSILVQKAVQNMICLLTDCNLWYTIILKCAGNKMTTQHSWNDDVQSSINCDDVLQFNPPERL